MTPGYFQGLANEMPGLRRSNERENGLMDGKNDSWDFLEDFSVM